MLKISIKNADLRKGLLLDVEGRLAGPWVEELNRCWESQQGKPASDAMIVRLSNVSFIDEAGTELLRKMFQAGAKLEGSGCMVRALIARITGTTLPVGDCKDERQKGVSMQSGVGAKGE